MIIESRATVGPRGPAVTVGHDRVRRRREEEKIPCSLAMAVSPLHGRYRLCALVTPDSDSLNVIAGDQPERRGFACRLRQSDLLLRVAVGLCESAAADHRLRRQGQFESSISRPGQAAPGRPAFGRPAVG